jgi:hypothetical protein
MRKLAIAALSLMSFGAAAQDAKSWLEAEGLEAASPPQAFQDIEVVVAKVKGAKDPVAAQERVVVLAKGKPVWQTSEKELLEPAMRFAVHSVGSDIDGDGAPDLHFSAYTGGAHCCTTHYVYRLRPQVRRVASYNSRNSGGSPFVEIPGRKTPVMISSDDSTALEFAPYANSYFPVVVLEVSRGRFQFVPDLMRTKLPGMPPPVCTQPVGSANAWLKGRCGEFSGSKAKARTAEIQAKLREVKSERSTEKAKWEDYWSSGVLSAIAAEMNRYAYTGHAGAGVHWFETVWPGNDAIKTAFVAKLRESRAKSVFAGELKRLSPDGRK